MVNMREKFRHIQETLLMERELEAKGLIATVRYYVDEETEEVHEEVTWPVGDHAEEVLNRWWMQ